VTEIEAQLQDKSFSAVGDLHGLSGQAIINFLVRHGVDPKKFHKKCGVKNSPKTSEPYHGKNGAAKFEKPYRPRVLQELPPGVNYSGENEYPDAPPYNYTHQGRYCGTELRGGSSASQAAMGGW
jgi:hypothetical protein